MKRTELLSLTGLTDEQLDRAFRKLERTDLIGKAEIPDEIAGQFIKGKQTASQQQTRGVSGKQPSTPLEQSAEAFLHKQAAMMGLTADELRFRIVQGQALGSTIAQVEQQGILAGYLQSMRDFFELNRTADIQNCALVAAKPLYELMAECGIILPRQILSESYQLIEDSIADRPNPTSPKDWMNLNEN